MLRLSKDEVVEIVKAYYGGEHVASIASRIKRDRATVRYHIEEYHNAYGDDESYIALMKLEVQHECLHPSMKCFCCGKLKDSIRRDDRMRIRELESELARLRGSGEHRVV